MPSNILHIPFQAVRNKQRPTVLTPKAAVCEILSSLRRSDYPRLGHALCIDDEHRAETGVADQEVSLLVNLKPVGACVSK